MSHWPAKEVDVRAAASLRELVQSKGGTVVALLHQIGQLQERAPISENTAVRYLKEMDFSYKRYRYG
jgi:hypothetical protein